ncbi:hypothetical protein ACFQI7_14300 [Paenibacillus allorhizosphaerae]|uniref:MFS transporter n=1 Tax=Paenibacillus allorhizosphaerae TaxID=2849866 RepID=A0ABM8VD45_9BACL|nr:hypothetical protein [Paenibacillus allorhizosphaerae]CAG7626330.1 hypothetical protein PAECIP111802_01239 [Paenibacillus allorhizosphaerae]
MSYVFAFSCIGAIISLFMAIISAFKGNGKFLKPLLWGTILAIICCFVSFFIPDTDLSYKQSLSLVGFVILLGVCSLGFVASIFMALFALFKRSGEFKKYVLIGISCMISVFIILIVAGATMKTDNEEAAIAEGSATEQQEMTQTQRERYADFEKKILDLAAQMNGEENGYLAFQNAFLKEPVPSPENYENAKKYKDAIAVHFNHLQTIDVPKDLPRKLKELATKGRGHINEAIARKEMALNALLNYINSKKVSDLNTFKENALLYTNEINSGLEKFSEAKKAMEPTE